MSKVESVQKLTVRQHRFLSVKKRDQHFHYSEFVLNIFCTSLNNISNFQIYEGQINILINKNQALLRSIQILFFIIFKPYDTKFECSYQIKIVDCISQ